MYHPPTASLMWKISVLLWWVHTLYAYWIKQFKPFKPTNNPNHTNIFWHVIKQELHKEIPSFALAVAIDIALDDDPRLEIIANSSCWTFILNHAILSKEGKEGHVRLWNTHDVPIPRPFVYIIQNLCASLVWRHFFALSPSNQKHIP